MRICPQEVKSRGHTRRFPITRLSSASVEACPSAVLPLGSMQVRRMVGWGLRSLGPISRFNLEPGPRCARRQAAVTKTRPRSRVEPANPGQPRSGHDGYGAVDRDREEWTVRRIWLAEKMVCHRLQGARKAIGHGPATRDLLLHIAHRSE